MKIKYYSEVLNKDFDTEEALHIAERQKKKEDEEAKAKIDEKEARRKEVKEAFDEAATAAAKYFERVNKFEDDYGELYYFDDLSFPIDVPKLFKTSFKTPFGFFK